jgi:glutaredoxin
MSKGIIIYGRTTGCPNCVIAKKYLDLRNKEYVFFDLDESPEMQEELKSKGLRALPVIYQDGELVGSGSTAVDKVV